MTTKKTTGYVSFPWRPYNNDEDATGEPGDGGGNDYDVLQQRWAQEAREYLLDLEYELTRGSL
jgi:hypothetical protein